MFGTGFVMDFGTILVGEGEREREIHYRHSASLADEDGTVFMSEPSAARQ